MFTYEISNAPHGLFYIRLIPPSSGSKNIDHNAMILQMATNLRARNQEVKSLQFNKPIQLYVDAKKADDLLKYFEMLESMGALNAEKARSFLSDKTPSDSSCRRPS